MDRQIHLDEHDEALADMVRAMIDYAVSHAHCRSGVAKRITSRAAYHRNLGRKAAKKRHPFANICEASGLALKSEHADLDELEP